MKVLLIADEYFSWGVHGGFGAFTRKLGRELVRRGVEVDAYVQRVSDRQKPVGETEVIDGVNVKTLPRRKPVKLWRRGLYKTNAQIIHSQCGMYDTYLAFKRNETKKVVTVQDLRTEGECQNLSCFERTSGYPWYKRLWKSYVMSCYRNAMQTSDVVAHQTRMLAPKIKEVYGVESTVWLPNFIDVPNCNLEKADEPTVAWLGRLDSIKQPELCFNLAKNCPDIQFYVLGSSHEAYGGADRDKRFMEKYGDVENLDFMGFQTGEVKEEILGRAWILINTSAYECLPVSFLEALAHKCALLSTQNPDCYTSNFGVHAMDSSRLKYCLDLLLKNDLWRKLGEKGYKHVKEVHSTEVGVNLHLQLYRKLLE